MENSEVPQASINNATPGTKRGKRKTQPAPTTPDLLGRRLFLRVREYSDLTGTPAPTVYALIASGRIEGVTRIGNSIRIPVAALKQLVA